MRLRNKKTGEIWATAVVNSYACGVGYRLRVTKDAYTQVGKHYDSLAELNEEWEDYEPAEPLIKDEKIRKAVRAWAEAFGVTNVYVVGIGDGKDYIELYAQDNWVTDGRIRISISTQNGVWIGKEYTITELCGEEEE